MVNPQAYIDPRRFHEYTYNLWEAETRFFAGIVLWHDICSEICDNGVFEAEYPLHKAVELLISGWVEWV